MSRTFVFGSEDWYKTIGYIFAGDDENTFSKEQIVDEIKYYYKKFEKDKINKAVKKLLSTSLADSLYANEGESRIKYEDAYKKRDLFVELMKCFSEFEQYEILRCFFGKGKFIGDNYDSINLKIKLESADEISSLIRKYDTLLKDTKAKEIEQKREILNEMLRLLEPKRNEIISINKKYEVIFYLGNNMNIRHNNQEGKYKNELFLSLEKKDVSLLYDELFYLIKIVVNELSDKNYYRHYELKNDILKKFMDLKEKQNNCDDCSSKS